MRGKGLPSKKKESKRKPGGPMTAAGLISFYEETESRIKLTPTWIFLISVMFVSVVVFLRAFF